MSGAADALVFSKNCDIRIASFIFSTLMSNVLPNIAHNNSIEAKSRAFRENDTVLKLNRFFIKAFIMRRLEAADGQKRATNVERARSNRKARAH